MIDRLETLIKRYKTKGVLIDSNIFLVWLIGLIERNLIPKFKRTSGYSSEDFDLLSLILGNFTVWQTTPNVLTEVNNLANQLDQHKKEAC